MFKEKLQYVVDKKNKNIICISTHQNIISRIVFSKEKKSLVGNIIKNNKRKEGNKREESECLCIFHCFNSSNESTKCKDRRPMWSMHHIPSFSCWN